MPRSTPLPIPQSLALAFSDRSYDRVLTELQEFLGKFSARLGSGFTHPLGFFRIELGSDPVGFRYFLHWWPQGVRCTQEPAWQVHRHVWDLESVVLDGRLLDRQAQRLEHREDATAVIYDAHVDAGSSTLVKTPDPLHLATIFRSGSV